MNSGKIILDFANPAGLRPRRICFFTGEGVTGNCISREWPLQGTASAAVGLRPKRSKSNAFYGNAPHRGAGAQRLRGVPIGGSRKYGEKIFTPNGVNLQYFRLEPTPLGSERGEQPLSRCGERGVQRERGGSRNTPLTLWPSGATPAAMPLAKAIGPAPRDCTLHEKHYKKAPAMRMHSGCLEGLCGGAQWVVPMSTARSASFFTTASTAFSRPRAIWCRSMLGVPRGLLTTCSMA